LLNWKHGMKTVPAFVASTAAVAFLAGCKGVPTTTGNNPRSPGFVGRWHYASDPATVVAAGHVVQVRIGKEISLTSDHAGTLTETVSSDGDEYLKSELAGLAVSGDPKYPEFCKWAPGSHSSALTWSRQDSADGRFLIFAIQGNPPLRFKWTLSDDGRYLTLALDDPAQTPLTYTRM